MKQKNLILMVVAVGCGLVAAFLTTQINAKPKIEMVKVLVAAKNLPVGTMFTKADVAILTTWKEVPKDSLPPAFVGTEEELLEKKLSQSLQKDMTFNPATLTKGGVVMLPDGKDMISLKVTAVDSAAGFIGPGSKVDILATLNLNGTYEAFPLLIDMQVMTVNAHTDYVNKPGGVFTDVNMVSLAVDQEEALLIKLAEQRNCHLSLLLRREGKPRDPSYDMKKVKKLLESEKNPIKLATTEGPGNKGATNEAPVPPVAVPEPPPEPVAPPKPETVKVLIALEDIAANTDINKELIEKKFKEKELPKEFAEDATTDIAPFFGQVFKTGVARGQWVTNALVGKPKTKPAPLDSHVENKPAPAVKEPPPKVEPKPIHDVAVHTASGTVIWRYEQQKSGEWKLVKKLTPEDSAKQVAKETAAAPEKPSGPEKQLPTPDAKKFD